MEIMFSDLTYEAQRRLLEEAGVDSPEEMGWDVDPVAVVEFEHEDDEPEDFTDEDYYFEDEN